MRPGSGYEAGDLLCFADGRRISHVALWAGAGRIVHSALARGWGVAIGTNLLGDAPAQNGCVTCWLPYGAWLCRNADRLSILCHEARSVRHRWDAPLD